MIVSQGKRVYLVRLEPGDEVISSFRKFAAKWNVTNAVLVSGIGMIEGVRLGFYRKGKGYEEHRFDRPVELVSLSGNISKREDGELIVHLHAAIADEKSRLFGGHLISAITAITVEGFVSEPKGIALVRVEDPGTGLSGLYPATASSPKGKTRGSAGVKTSVRTRASAKDNAYPAERKGKNGGHNRRHHRHRDHYGELGDAAEERDEETSSAATPYNGAGADSIGAISLVSESSSRKGTSPPAERRLEESGEKPTSGKKRGRPPKKRIAPKKVRRPAKPAQKRAKRKTK
jgi:uncharacterized protein